MRILDDEVGHIPSPASTLDLVDTDQQQYNISLKTYHRLTLNIFYAPGFRPAFTILSNIAELGNEEQ